MKIKDLLLTAVLMAGSTMVQAQFLKKLKDKAQAAADRKINSTVDRTISKTTDKVVDSTTGKIEKVAKDISKRKKDKKNASDKSSPDKSIPETEGPIAQDSTARKEPV